MENALNFHAIFIVRLISAENTIKIKKGAQ